MYVGTPSHNAVQASLAARNSWPAPSCPPQLPASLLPHLWQAVASAWSNRMSSASCRIWRFTSSRHRRLRIRSRCVCGAVGAKEGCACAQGVDQARCALVCQAPVMARAGSA